MGLTLVFRGKEEKTSALSAFPLGKLWGVTQHVHVNRAGSCALLSAATTAPPGTRWPLPRAEHEVTCSLSGGQPAQQHLPKEHAYGLPALPQAYSPFGTTQHGAPSRVVPRRRLSVHLLAVLLTRTNLSFEFTGRAGFSGQKRLSAAGKWQVRKNTNKDAIRLGPGHAAIWNACSVYL